MYFHLTVRKWRLGMGYGVMNMHDIESRMYFRPMVYLEIICRFLIGDARGREFEIILTKSDKEREGIQKQLVFRLRNFWMTPI